MDLTSDTVTASVLNSGYTAHDAAGEAITGTGSGGGGDSWSWMGKNPTLVHTYTPESVYFKDSSFSTWTWSTSTITLRAATSYEAVTVDDAHEYLQVYNMYAHYDYGTWTPVSAIRDFAFSAVIGAIRCVGGLASAQTETKTTLYALSGNLTAGSFEYYSYYYDGNGDLKFGELYYGLCNYNTATGTVGSPTSSSPILTCKMPALVARGNATYFSQTAYQNIDMDSSYYKTSCELWRVDAGTLLLGNTREAAVHILNNGL